MLACVLGVPVVADAQDVSLRGRVIAVVEGDSLPVADEWVLLHEVTEDGGRAVDSARTGADGLYVVRLARRDTSAVYITSVEFRDIAYFSTPLAHAAAEIEPLVVFDTTSAGPPLAVAERHVVVRAANPDGSRDVLELIVLENRTDRTRISADTARPVWEQRLPEDAFAFEVAPNDVSPAAIVPRGNGVAVFAAIPPGPGNRKQIVFGYSLPPSLRTLRLPVDADVVGRLQVLIEDPAVEIQGDALESLGVERMEDIEFQRFEATGVEAGTRVQFRFAGGLSATALFLIGLSVTGLIMVAVLGMWWRRPLRVAAPADDADALAVRIAALDERHAAVENADERAAYERERAALKARLLRALADPKSKR